MTRLLRRRTSRGTKVQDQGRLEARLPAGQLQVAAGCARNIGCDRQSDPAATATVQVWIVAGIVLHAAAVVAHRDAQATVRVVADDDADLADGKTRSVFQDRTQGLGQGGRVRRGPPATLSRHGPDQGSIGRNATEHADKVIRDPGRISRAMQPRHIADRMQFAFDMGLHGGHNFLDPIGG